ncbi:hypothetical protein JHW43_000462 [Diplocarpon mali]|nr:hypothetical protein JHW43_000462 [Diplocarpon mali]
MLVAAVAGPVGDGGVHRREFARREPGGRRGGYWWVDEGGGCTSTNVYKYDLGLLASTKNAQASPRRRPGRAISHASATLFLVLLAAASPTATLVRSALSGKFPKRRPESSVFNWGRRAESILNSSASSSSHPPAHPLASISVNSKAKRRRQEGPRRPDFFLARLSNPLGARASLDIYDNRRSSTCVHVNSHLHKTERHESTRLHMHTARETGLVEALMSPLVSLAQQYTGSNRGSRRARGPSNWQSSSSLTGSEPHGKTAESPLKSPLERRTVRLLAFSSAAELQMSTLTVLTA